MKYSLLSSFLIEIEMVFENSSCPNIPNSNPVAPLFRFVKEAGYYEAINIGKMIEILDKNWFIEILTGEGEPDCKIKLIERKDCRDRFDNAREETFEADELVDALWEAIKEVV